MSRELTMSAKEVQIIFNSQTGLDGAVTDAYCNMLANILFNDPSTFVNCCSKMTLADFETKILKKVRYGVSYFPSKYPDVLDELNSISSLPTITEEELEVINQLVYMLSELSEKP